MTHRTVLPDRVYFGVDVLLEDPSVLSLDLRRGVWGLVTNDAARCSGLPEMLSRRAITDAGYPVSQLFSPEHGISRTGEDGRAMDDQHDPVTGLPVCSLYGKTMQPPDALLRRLSGVLFDIPDIGSRFYTYIWTLSHVMEACAEAKRPLVVLDRPNPLGGLLSAAEGPVLDTVSCSSFLGRAPMPIRHSLSAGEFARWLRAEWQLDLDLHIVPARGWKREFHWPHTGLPFVPTSPAMPSYDSALCYPGTCLFEATNLSTGRGTATPFEHVGAPWLNARRVIAHCDSFARNHPGMLAGFRLEETRFVPQEEPCKMKECQGIRLIVTEPEVVRPVRAGLMLLTVIRQFHPDSFTWKTYPTAANPSGECHFERLIGDLRIRPQLESEPESFLRRLPELLDASGWKEEVREHLLYD